MDPLTGFPETLEMDILGQQPGLSLYTQLCFCFAKPWYGSNQEIVDIIRSGLDRLTQDCFWIGGHVINEGATTTDRGINRMGRFGHPPHLEVKIYEDATEMSLQKLRDAKYSATVLREEFFASRLTFPDRTKEGTPVFEVQANFCVDGLILTIVGQHQAMDMTGQEVLTRLLSKACRNEKSTAEEIGLLHISRQSTVKLLPSDDTKDGQSTSSPPVATAPETAAKPTAAAPAISNPACSWVFFNFTAQSLENLKAHAMQGLQNGFVSTNDALTAFIWQSLTRARSTKLPPGTKLTLGRAVDGRRFFSYAAYPGLIQSMAWHHRTTEQISSESLGSIASDLRYAIDPKTTKIAVEIQKTVTRLATTTSRTHFAAGSGFDHSTGLLLSSWSNFGSYDLDFGLGLGKPEMIRRPAFTTVEGLAYLMPKTPAGDIALMLCVSDEDLARLRDDEEFSKYASYIG